MKKTRSPTNLLILFRLPSSPLILAMNMILIENLATPFMIRPGVNKSGKNLLPRLKNRLGLTGTPPITEY